MQKVINTLVVILVGFALYYGIIVDSERIETMEALRLSDEELQGHKSVIDEEYRRLTLMFEGRGKHIQAIQADIANLQNRVIAITDSLGTRIEETNYYLGQADELLREDIQTVGSDLRLIEDDVALLRRTTTRGLQDLTERLDVLESDLNALDEQVNPPERTRN